MKSALVLFALLTVSCCENIMALGEDPAYAAASFIPAQPASLPEATLVKLHRYKNRPNLDHFYTITYNEEYNKFLASLNYTYEGVAGRIFREPKTGTVPLHRYWNTAIRNHFYTTNWEELGGGKSGYKYQNIEGYVFPSPVTGTLPLFRYYNANRTDHFYTTRWDELKDGSTGYRLEGIQAYVFP